MNWIEDHFEIVIVLALAAAGVLRTVLGAIFRGGSRPEGGEPRRNIRDVLEEIRQEAAKEADDRPGREGAAVRGEAPQRRQPAERMWPLEEAPEREGGRGRMPRPARDPLALEPVERRQRAPAAPQARREGPPKDVQRNVGAQLAQAAQKRAAGRKGKRATRAGKEGGRRAVPAAVKDPWAASTRLELPPMAEESASVAASTLAGVDLKRAIVLQTILGPPRSLERRGLGVGALRPRDGRR